MSRLTVVILSVCCCGGAAYAAACRGANPEYGVPYAQSTGGDADRGRAVLAQYGCGACHIIPGVDGANGLVAPPLTLFAHRTFIAGEVPNTPDNLIKWIRTPQAIEARTAMPALGLSDREAHDAAAYLYTLR